LATLLCAARVGSGAEALQPGLRHVESPGASGIDYWLYVPAGYDASKPHGLVVVLHPAGLDASHHTRQWGVLAEKVGGLLVAGPEAQDETRHFWKMRDEPVVLTVVQRVAQRYNIDRQRILLTGFSLGGNYAYKFGLRNPNVFRAVAAFSGVLLARPSPAADAILRRAKGVAVYIVHGGQDTRVPVERARASRDRLGEFGNRIVYRELPNLRHQFAPLEAVRVLHWFKNLPKREPAAEKPAKDEADK
jgi:phospholipase/carboxylesterase